MHLSSISVRDYDLRKTLTSGQVFHWTQVGTGSWESAWSGSWVRLSQHRPGKVVIETDDTSPAFHGLMRDYLQLDLAVGPVIATFPSDPLMQTAIQAQRGLRLLRQDPWVCLASFLLSSTKQITQIQGIVDQLSTRLGREVSHPEGQTSRFSFPDPMAVVQAGEQALRDCKAGFRAKYLYACAEQVVSGQFNLKAPRQLTLSSARDLLVSLPGVGPKIADCVLLFAYGFQEAFPVDVWVQRVLQDYYFKDCKLSTHQMHLKALDYFGKHAGYAQQYLFDYIRSLSRQEWEYMVSTRGVIKG
ncbi:MAG: DNA glycosylase [Verrucomicrobiota bacterium]|nr:DNA glycosylase [Verrucomicrobiota bacterium]